MKKRMVIYVNCLNDYQKCSSTTENNKVKTNIISDGENQEKPNKR